MQGISTSGLSDRMDSDFRNMFEDTGSLDCLEFLRSVGYLGKLSPDNVFDYMKLFMQLKSGESFPPPKFLSHTPQTQKALLLEKRLCDEGEDWFVHCRMNDTEGPYRVNRGTRVKNLEAPSLQQSHKDLRNELILSGILIRDVNRMVFSRNYEFNSLSAAASVICGTNCDGWKVFKIAGTDQLAATLRQ